MEEFRKKLTKLSLKEKIKFSKEKIKEFYECNNGKVYISFSGGRDSTVLLDIIRTIYPDMKAAFLDTGLEYPEIRNFVKTFSNVTIVKPRENFKNIIKKFGYPVISKEQSGFIYEIKNSKSKKTIDMRLNGKENGFGKLSKKWRFLLDEDIKISNKCCYYLKKKPIKFFETETKLKPYLGMLYDESMQRKKTFYKIGCNNFNKNRPTSNPLYFWNIADIYTYIRLNKLKLSEIYNMGYERTGCMFCLYGLQQEAEGFTRFDKMKETHPSQYKYCMNKLGLKKVIKILDKARK